MPFCFPYQQPPWSPCKQPQVSKIAHLISTQFWIEKLWNLKPDQRKHPNPTYRPFIDFEGHEVCESPWIMFFFSGFYLRCLIDYRCGRWYIQYVFTTPMILNLVWYLKTQSIVFLGKGLSFNIIVMCFLNERFILLNYLSF